MHFIVACLDDVFNYSCHSVRMSCSIKKLVFTYFVSSLLFFLSCYIELVINVINSIIRTVNTVVIALFVLCVYWTYSYMLYHDEMKILI